MNQTQLPYVLLYLCSTFLSSVSQVLLKKAAMREHTSLVAEYTDWRVILGYGLMQILPDDVLHARGKIDE